MAGLFADEGITGTSAQKRPEFLRLIRQCRQKKIDLVLTMALANVGSAGIMITFGARFTLLMFAASFPMFVHF